jgi:hypothetical protein
MRQSRKAYKEITAILEVFYLCKNVSEYAKSNFACMENKLKEYKRIWRIRQECFDVLYMESYRIEPISMNFLKKFGL